VVDSEAVNPAQSVDGAEAEATVCGVRTAIAKLSDMLIPTDSTAGVETGGEPVTGRSIVSGEMHYARIPREYWTARLRSARAMGLNTVSTYVFWNVHEPSAGVFDFSGWRDIAAFVREAHTAGLNVILRPGPYVCAEWDFGGLPAWLLAGDDLGVRTADERFMRFTRRWFARLGQELAPLQTARGGPIVAVQLENEAGADGNDRTYLVALRAALDDAGFGESPYFTIDQPQDAAAESLPGVRVAMTWGAGSAGAGLEQLRRAVPEGPLFCGEYWAGWYDYWGEPRIPLDDAAQAAELAAMLAANCSLNVYMIHGGTNFGFWNGANACDALPYRPVTTSYDYHAAIDEAGRTTPKYDRFRAAIAQATGVEPPPLGDEPSTIALPEFRLEECASLRELCGTPIETERPQTMEYYGQGYGYILYRTEIQGPQIAMLEFEDLRDYAVVLVNGAVEGRLDRRLGQRNIPLRCPGQRAQLEVLVENGGRINYGGYLARDRKGIVGPVVYADAELRDWTALPLPMNDLAPLRFVVEPFGVEPVGATVDAPLFRRGYFEVDQLADSFLDVSSLGKGTLWVNGHHLGRFWSIGPQRSLYLPGVWLKRGRNEVIAFDLSSRLRPALRGLTDPLFDQPDPAVVSTLPLGVCCAACHAKGEAHGLRVRQNRKLP
jgi:beta-galactosidase